MLSYLRTPSGLAWRPADDRKAYIVWVGLIWLGMIGGFLPDLARYGREAPSPPLILNVHGVVYFAWLVLVAAQVALIEVKKPEWHRRLGWALVVMSAAIVPLGFVAAMVDQARQVSHADYGPEFLGLEFQSLVIFPAFIAAATLLRRDPAAHKRLMILAAVAILDPGTARAFGFFSPWKPGGAFGFWLSFFWANALLAAAMIGWDLWKRRRAHPTLLAGAGLLAIGEAAAVVLQFAPWWRAAMVRLVAWWGWAG